MGSLVMQMGVPCKYLHSEEGCERLEVQSWREEAQGSLLSEFNPGLLDQAGHFLPCLAVCVCTLVLVKWLLVALSAWGKWGTGGFYAAFIDHLFIYNPRKWKVMEPNECAPEIIVEGFPAPSLPVHSPHHLSPAPCAHVTINTSLDWGPCQSCMRFMNVRCVIVCVCAPGGPCHTQSWPLPTTRRTVARPHQECVPATTAVPG